MNLKSFSKEILPLLDGELRQIVDTTAALDHGFLREMFSYHLGWVGENAEMARGKQIRPLLVMLCGMNEGMKAELLLPAAASVELIHNFSLIHDDIQDNSDTRRGRETVWVKWGVPQAINTGDAMFTLSYEAMMGLMARGIKPEVVTQCVRVLTETNLMLTKGQHMDIAFEKEESVGVETYQEMIEGKTAALVQASCQLGAILAEVGKEKIQNYAAFGKHVGIAFQLRDDYLGIWGDDQKTGKSVQSDFLERKKTYPILYAWEKSEAFRALWAKDAFSKEDMIAMANEMINCGAMDAVLDVFQTHEKEAVRILNEISPSDEYRGVFDELIEMLSVRDF